MNKLSHINKMASPYRHATLLKNINHNLFICILILLLLPFAIESAEVDGNSREFPNDDGNERRLTREYDLRQGALRGLIVRPSRFYELQNIEMFLGIPYAAPPIGSLRFMPPVSAPPWPGVKKAMRFAPVCPQRLPVIKKGNPPTLGRQHYISRLKKFLTNESEDCLYLNIYVPYREQKSKRFPVLVFIHGDSFEWSSGNPYDGRILAAYGNIMVITINYRLGILGFMKPSLTEHVYGNNGLLDQLAALKWIKDNIEDLNGDSRSVTIMGHGTGAACVNFLMLSPISNGLFHRAILMSGSALSDWAMTKDPSQYTLQVAQSLGCNPNSKDMMACLQEKPLSEIKRTQIWARDFETPLGPIVAGSFIPNEPFSIMESYPDLMSKYQLLFGVTEIESYNDFGVIELDHGVLENQRDDFIRKYAKIVFGGAEDVALKEILKKYATTSLDPQRWTVEQNREFILNVFSEARTTAPLLRFANYQSMANKHSYFYVFGHNSVSTEYASLNNSIHGEDLPYIFGVPLGSTNTHFHTEYTQKEKLFSEVIMKMWTNFVKTGSPNSYNIHEFYTMDKHNWKTYNIDWPQYNAQYQNYLRLDIPPAIRTYYRSNFTNFWVNELPSKMRKYVVDPLFEFTPAVPSTQKPKPVIKKTEPTRRPWNPAAIQTPHYVPSSYGKLRPYSPPISRPDTEQIYREIQSIKTPARPIPTNFYEKPETTPETKVTETETEKQVNTSEATIALIVSLAILFIAINIAICLIVYLKRKKGQARDNTIAVAGHSKAELGTVDMIGKKCEKDDKSAIQTLKNSCSIIKSIGFNKIRGSNQKLKTNKAELCKTPKSDDSGGFRERFQLRRHLSTSTLDAQTKVRDWIANDVMHKCSSNNIRKSNSNVHLEKPKVDKNPQTLTSKSEEILTERMKKDLVNIGEVSKTASLKINQKLPKSKTSEKTTSTSALDSLSSIHSGKQSLSSIKQTGKSNDSLKSKGSESVKSKKVSVAIDATPSARTNSILKQEPIELSKSLDCTDNPVKHSKTDQELQTKTDGEIIHEILGVETNAKSNENKIFKSVVNVSVNDNNKLKISHKHSSSDPVTDINYDKYIKNKYDCITPNITLLPPITFRNDVNVTSRDEKIPSQSLTPSEALLTIQRRNYPKVLPDFPKSQKRLSLQPNALQSFKNISKSFENQVDTRPKVPPQPPPRTSTLDKRLAFRNSRSNTSSFESTSTKKSTDKTNFSMNYENIDELSPSRVKKIENKSFDSFVSSQAPQQDKTKPRIIIASSDIPGNREPRLMIKPSASNIEIPSNAPRIRLPDDFHSQASGSITSFSCESDDNSGDDVDDEDFEDDLIQELVGSVDLPENPLLDSKGPATAYEKKLEIIPVKIKTTNGPVGMKDDYVCISDLHLPDIGNFEQTARIKPNFGLNKLQHRTENLNNPLEKSIKLKQKKSLKPSSILNKSLKIKDKKKHKNESKIEHSESNSSNDTETSTGTVKRVEIKKL